MSGIETQVVVIGAGPVGLTIAIDLAQRGIEVCVLEQGQEAQAGDAKCNTVSARTMEVFRRLGIADQVRAAGLPDDYPTDAVFTSGFDGQEFTRIRLPSRNERFASDGRSAEGFLDSDWRTPEPVVRVSQYFLNPVLYQYAKRFPEITLMPGIVFRRYGTLEGGVRVFAESADGSQRIEVEGDFLIGCDGGRSAVRKQMGVQFLGDGQLGRTRSSLVRSPEIRTLYKGRPAWMNWIANSKVSGVCIAIDGEELWLLHRNVPRMASDFEDLDRDQSIRDLLGVGADFDWEVLQHVDWTARRLVASRFRQGNVFVAGDAAHIWIPMAGYGMNAGVADGMNLSWLMAAVLEGHAPPAILDAHELERHPITEQVSRLAMGKALELAGQYAAKERIASVREHGRRLFEINAPQFVCEGLNFGYYYDNSPLIVYDGETAPGYDMGSATPSTVPGCRLPHFWVDGNVSIYDLLDPYYSLLRFNGNRMDGSFEAAFAASNLPLAIIDAEVNEPCFQHDYLLVRCDQHVCWRGSRLPDDMSRIIATLTGQVPSGPLETQRGRQSRSCDTDPTRLNRPM